MSNITPKELILRFFKENTEFDYTVKDIARRLSKGEQLTSKNARIYQTLVAELVREGKIIKIRKTSNFSKWGSNNDVYSYQLAGWLTEERKIEAQKA